LTVIDGKIDVFRLPVKVWQRQVVHLLFLEPQKTVIAEGNKGRIEFVRRDKYGEQRTRTTAQTKVEIEDIFNGRKAMICSFLDSYD